MKIYYPYKSDKKDKKYFIVTLNGDRVYFGASGYEDFTTHKDEKRREAYIRRHEKNENKFWDDPNTASYWALKYLWLYPTKKEAYENIKKELKKKGFI